MNERDEQLEALIAVFARTPGDEPDWIGEQDLHRAWQEYMANAILNAGFRREEPEWEYGTRCPMKECTEPHPLEEGDAPPGPAESLWRRTRERTIPAGEWERVS